MESNQSHIYHSSSDMSDSAHQNEPLAFTTQDQWNASSWSYQNQNQDQNASHMPFVAPRSDYIPNIAQPRPQYVEGVGHPSTYQTSQLQSSMVANPYAVSSPSQFYPPQAHTPVQTHRPGTRAGLPEQQWAPRNSYVDPRATPLDLYGRPPLVTPRPGSSRSSTHVPGSSQTWSGATSGIGPSNYPIHESSPFTPFDSTRHSSPSISPQSPSSRTANPSSSNSRSSPSTSTTGSAKECSHCHAKSTPLWRREPQTLRTLCNACGLYLQQRNKLRPQELIDADEDDDEEEDPASYDPNSPECSHCHTHQTSVWRRSKEGQQLCNACGVYSRLRGRDRPLSLKRNKIKPRSKHN